MALAAKAVKVATFGFPAISTSLDAIDAVEVLRKYRLLPPPPSSHLFEPTATYYIDYEKLGIFSEEDHKNASPIYDYKITKWKLFVPLRLPPRDLVERETNKTVAHFEGKFYIPSTGILGYLSSIKIVANQKGE